MIAASLYIVVCSARNRLLMRLRRLREPRYFVGAIAGAAYLYFSVFARLRSAGGARRRRGAAAVPLALGSLRAGAAGLVGLLLLAVALLAWILPFDSGLLAFSDAEIQFLFPAPVSRRALLVHRMIRSQIGLLFGGVIIGIATPSISAYGRLRTGIAMWLLLSAGKVYFTGVSLARTKLASHEAGARRAAWLPLAALAAAALVVAASLYRAFAAGSPTSLNDLLERVAGATAAGAAGIALWPFAALARPIFAAGAAQYAEGLLASTVVLAAAIAWVLQTDAALEDSAAAAAERRAADAAAQAAPYRASRTSLSLAPFGRAEAIFAWKAATQTLRGVDRLAVLRVAVLVVAMTAAATTVGRGNGLRALAGSFALAMTGFVVLMAPQVLRVDMREDLRHLEVLKTWPVRAPAIVRGELVWPGVILTAAAWTALAIAALLAGPTLFARLRLSWLLSAAAAVAIIAPALIFAQLTIHNAAALIFPAWVPLGQQRPRGLDAMGQRLIMLGATWLLLIVSLIPGAIAAAIVWFALRIFVGPAALVPAAVVCAASVAVEVLLATEALGPAYEALDLTAIERVE